MPTHTSTLVLSREPVDIVVMECGPVFPEDGGSRHPSFPPDDGGYGGRDLAPRLCGPDEPPLGGGDGYQPHDAPGGAGSDAPVLAMLLPVWPDEDGSKGGKRYPGILRNIAEVVMCPEEYDGQAPQFGQVDDKDEEYREEDEEGEEDERLPTDKPQFVSVEVVR